MRFFILTTIMANKVEPWLQDKLGDVPIIGQLFSGIPTGVDVLTTSLVLSIMIIPFMSAVVRDSFEMVPSVMKESAYALGATQWEVVRKVVIPYTASVNWLARVTVMVVKESKRDLGICGMFPAKKDSAMDSPKALPVDRIRPPAIPDAV